MPAGQENVVKGRIAFIRPSDNHGCQQFPLPQFFTFQLDNNVSHSNVPQLGRSDVFAPIRSICFTEKSVVCQTSEFSF